MALAEGHAGDFPARLERRLHAVLGAPATSSPSAGGRPGFETVRLSSDTYLVAIPDIATPDALNWLVDRLLDELAAPYPIGGAPVAARVTIGVSLYPGDGTSAETLIAAAETAFRHALGGEGGSGACLFSKATPSGPRPQAALADLIRAAIAQKSFELHFQPIVDIRTGGTEALEALLRCTHPDLAGTSIGRIIAIAEQEGLIVDIGNWAARQAIAQGERWRRHGLDVPTISINLSAVQLNDPEAMDAIMQMVMEMRLPPNRIQFEVTETALMHDAEAAGLALMRLQQMGAMIALDDFGTGQSSLAYLRRFRPDVLKIDRCFISEIATSGADETLVSAIVALSHRLNLGVVAEGVETEAQFARVREIGCDAVQGFLVARPMPAHLALEWLARRAEPAGRAAPRARPRASR